MSRKQLVNVTTLRLSPEDKKRLERVAGRLNLDMAAVARIIILWALKKLEDGELNIGEMAWEVAGGEKQ